MLLKKQDRLARLVRNFLLPLICLYLVFSVPFRIYEKNLDQYSELQEQPVEEKETCETSDEAEALVQPDLRLHCLDVLLLHLSASDLYSPSGDYRNCVHQPPER